MHQDLENTPARRGRPPAPPLRLTAAFLGALKGIEARGIPPAKLLTHAGCSKGNAYDVLAGRAKQTRAALAALATAGAILSVPLDQIVAGRTLGPVGLEVVEYV